MVRDARLIPSLSLNDQWWATARSARAQALDSVASVRPGARPRKFRFSDNPAGQSRTGHRANCSASTSPWNASSGDRSAGPRPGSRPGLTTPIGGPCRSFRRLNGSQHRKGVGAVVARRPGKLAQFCQHRQRLLMIAPALELLGLQPRSHGLSELLGCRVGECRRTTEAST